MQLGAGILVRPQLIANGHGSIYDSGDPVVGARWLERDRALGQTESSDAAGGIILVGSGALRDSKCHSERESDQTYELERMSFHNHISLLKLERSELGLPRVLPLGPIGVWSGMQMCKYGPHSGPGRIGHFWYVESGKARFA